MLPDAPVRARAPSRPSAPPVSSVAAPTRRLTGGGDEPVATKPKPTSQGQLLQPVGGSAVPRSVWLLVGVGLCALLALGGFALAR